MHELNLALDVVARADQEVKRTAGKGVKRIVLEISRCSEIQVPEFESLWPVITYNTVLAKADHRIIEVETEVRCSKCSSQFTINRWYVQCPSCGSFLCDISKVDPIRIKSLQVV